MTTTRTALFVAIFLVLALTWLEHAWTTHDAGVTELLYNPFLSAYKDDPRFIAFAQKIGVLPKAAAK